MTLHRAYIEGLVVGFIFGITTGAIALTVIIRVM